MPYKMLEREGLGSSERVKFLANQEFLDPSTTISNVYGAVHLAFSRRMQPAKDIASSIAFAAAMFHKFKSLNIKRVINMSSQGVYGNTDAFRTEDTPPAPATQYTMAKYAAEVIFEDILNDCEKHTSFRLDPVAQSQNVLQRLCKSAREGKISLKGGKQVFSFIDADDVPGAVLAMLESDGPWDTVYNVGWNRKRITLVELAGLVAEAAACYGYSRPLIELEEDDTALWAGMDSTKFMRKTGWSPSIELSDTISSMF
jgi:nucleoside-diphosphate-sugar epimerase